MWAGFIVVLILLTVLTAVSAEKLKPMSPGTSVVVGGVSIGTLIDKLNELEDRIQALERNVNP